YGEAEHTFRGWLLTITRTTIIDFARRRLHEPKATARIEDYQALLFLAGERLADGDSSVSVRSSELANAVVGLKNEFAELTWSAFWRTAVDGLSAAEAGAELGMTPQAVRKAKSRVLARLRFEFRGLLD